MPGILFGLVPALAFTREVDGQPLHSSRAGSLQLRSRRLHRGLVLSEIALSIVPLVAAGLMLRTFANFLDTPIGFDPAHVVTARVSLNLSKFSTVDRRSAFYRDAIARVRELPGVEAASIGGPPPLASVQSTMRFCRSDDGEGTIGMHRSVMPGYLGVMGIPLRTGRDISDDDIIHSRRVAVVDERLAAQFWQGSAIGKRLSVDSKQPLEVVGVAGHIRARDIRDSGTTCHLTSTRSSKPSSSKRERRSRGSGPRSKGQLRRSVQGDPSSTSGQWPTSSRRGSTTRDSPC